MVESVLYFNELKIKGCFQNPEVCATNFMTLNSRLFIKYHLQLYALPGGLCTRDMLVF